MSNPLVIYHPADTSKIFENKNLKPDHLWYLIHYNQNALYGKEKQGFGKEKKKIRNEFLSFVIEAGKKAYQRRFRALQSMEAQCLVKVFKLSGDSLIVHGLGASHVTENSLTIHPVYGIPFVPASSVKGIVRRWFIDAVLEGKAENLKAMDDNKAVIGRSLFGTNESEGIIQFYDILMYEGLEITVDILNPHFSNYYSSKQEPEDTLFPIPNTFYAVKISSANLTLTVDKCKLAEWLSVINLNEVEVMTLISRWVALAFQELGVGGKTSSGYGHFSNIEEVYDAFTQQQIKMEEDEKKKI
ncbi:type III-B CRISPR module RAMP protein Cmr6 [Paenibacillus sp. FSL L8-0638]|uniref:type III-B CRISPR module RAMP protein Cmr6 n=1 Tax=Paenibacillus TaxID=44249 RepID=UPI00315936F1